MPGPALETVGDSLQPTRRRIVTGVLALLLALFVVVVVLAGGLPYVEPPGRTHEAGGSGELRGAAATITIGGDVEEPISPGSLVPLDLELTNPYDVEVTVHGLTVAVTHVDAPRSDADHACTVADFEVRMLAPDLELSLPPGTSRLSGQGLAPSQWPAVGMTNRPVNQDGCKGASMTLEYEASGAGEPG